MDDETTRPLLDHERRYLAEVELHLASLARCTRRELRALEDDRSDADPGTWTVRKQRR